MKRLVKSGVLCCLIVLLAVSTVFAFDCTLTQTLKIKYPVYTNALAGVGIFFGEVEFAIETGTIKYWDNVAGSLDDLIINSLKGDTEGHVRVCAQGGASHPGDVVIVDTFFIDDPANPPIGLKIRMVCGNDILEISLSPDMTAEEIEQMVRDFFVAHIGAYKEWWVATVMDALIAVLRVRGLM